MIRRTLRMALLVGAVTAAAVSPAWAQHRAPCCNEPCGAPVACAPAPTAPALRTITVTECVPETYTVKRTAYKYECRTEMVNSFRTECVPVVREKICTVVKRVPVVTTQMRKCCNTVTCYEDRTVMKKCYQTVQQTCMKKHCVRLGHWECRETCSTGSLGLFGGHKSNCCDPCATSCCTVKTRKVWVHCPEYCETPYTVCKKVCVQVPTVCKVKVCRQVWTETPVQVCTYQCVTQQVAQKYTCMVTRQVPCQVARTVRVCVPYETTATCCRMVQRTRQVQVACTPACTTSCSSPCCDTGCSTGHGRRFFRGHGGCSSCCN